MNDNTIWNKRTTGIAWGLLLLCLGVFLIIPGDQSGPFALGAGIILLGLNLSRRLRGLPVSPFSVSLGALAAGIGTYALLRPILHGPHFEIGLLPLGLIVAGLYVLLPGPRPAANSQ